MQPYNEMICDSSENDVCVYKMARQTWNMIIDHHFLGTMLNKNSSHFVGGSTND